MNKQLKAAYVGIKDNVAVVFETNLNDFVEKLKVLEPSCRNYNYYYRRFKEQTCLMKQ